MNIIQTLGKRDGMNIGIPDPHMQMLNGSHGGKELKAKYSRSTNDNDTYYILNERVLPA